MRIDYNPLVTDIQTVVGAQIEQLHNAANVQESSRAAGVAKEAAILGALVAMESNEFTKAAATLLADALKETATATTNAATKLKEALDSNTEAANKSSAAMFWLTLAYVGLTAVIAVTALVSLRRASERPAPPVAPAASPAVDSGRGSGQPSGR